MSSKRKYFVWVTPTDGTYEESDLIPFEEAVEKYGLTSDEIKIMTNGEIIRDGLSSKLSLTIF